MQKTVFRKIMSPSVTALPSRFLFLLSGLFIIGSVLGLSAASAVTTASAHDALLTTFSGDSNLLLVFFSISKYHFLILIFGVAAFGSFVLPVFSLIKGFTLVFSSACLSVFFEHNGFSVCFVAFVFVEILATVILFVLTVSSFRTSSRITRILFGGRDSFNSVFTREHLIIVLVSFLSLFLLSLIYKNFFLNYISTLFLV